MKRKSKFKFISDKRRKSYINAVNARISRGKSVLVEGNYGSGKSSFLELIEPKNMRVITAEPLSNIHHILPQLLRQLDYDANMDYRRTPQYLDMLCNSDKQFTIMIDEVNELDKRVWSYLKRITDSGVPMVLAGLPKVRTFLEREYPDILSRLKVLVLYPVEVDDFISDYKDRFEPEAVEQIYAHTRGDMRKFQEITEDCLDKAAELKLVKVDVMLVLEFLTQ